MSTRKRPRPSAQLEEAQPPSRDNDHQAGVASHMDAEGAQPSPRPSRSVKQPALHGSSEAQTQQLFQALRVLEQLALPQLVRLADEHSIVWCRLKGFPAWPAQVMTAAAAKPRLRPEPKPGRLPVMFFGTIEVAWASSKDVISWGQGIKDDLWSKNKQKNRQTFDLGFEQVRDFLHPHAVRKSPQHWWCKPPVQHLKPAAQHAPKSTPRAAKPAHKAAPKAATAPPKASSQAPAADPPQATVTRHGRVMKLPARLATQAAAEAASSEDGDMDSTAAQALAADAKESKQKPRKSPVKPRSSNKMLHVSNEAQLEKVPSQAAGLDATVVDAHPASGRLEVSGAVQPAPNQVNQPAPKQRRASVSSKGVNQGVRLGSGFLAKALGQLMDDGYLLEALQDLLAAMPKLEPVPLAQDTLPWSNNDPVFQAATSNLEHGSISMLEVDLGAQAKPESPGASELQITNAPVSAAKAEEQGVSTGNQQGKKSAPENAGQPADTNCIAQQPAEVPSAAMSATLGTAVLPKRLKGGAAVLAKVLNLDMLAPSDPQPKASTSALQSGSESGVVHASSLQVALAGLGLDEQQLRRVVVMLVAQLKQKTAQKQPVTLQGLSSEAQQGLQDLKAALQAASGYCHAPATAAATQQHPQPTAVLAAQPAALNNVPAQLAASELQEARDRAPQYTHIDKNLYAKPPHMPARPKRQPKDDIPVCNCHLPGSNGFLGALPARQPTQRQASSTLRKQILQKAAEQAQALLPADGQAGPTAQVRVTEDAADHAMSGATVQGVEPLGTMPNGVTPSPGGMYNPRGAAASPMGPAAAAERVGCGEECLNRLSYIHCDPKLCPCGLQCSNRPFHQLQSPKVEVFLTRDRGWGVKAAEPIVKGSFIVEYAGEVITDSVCEQRMQVAKQTGEPHFYMMELAPGLIIDARSKGNVARLINSSCAPNCESQKWHDASNGEVKVGIFALRDIPVGEELSYDYQFQHYGLAQAAGDYRCMCGAPTCRGTMDSQPERRKDFGKRVEVWWEGDNVYYRGTIFEYSKNTDKHTVYYDDGEKEKVSLATTPHSQHHQGIQLRHRKPLCKRLLVVSTWNASHTSPPVACRWLDEGASQHSSPRYPTPDSEGRCLPPRLPSPQGKPPAKGKVTAKPAPKKQRKRKLDDVHLHAATAQLQNHSRPAPQPAVPPSLAAASPVPFNGSPAVHADVTCSPEPVQAAAPVASATSEPAVLPVTQQLLLTSEVARSLASAAHEAEEVASVTAVAASVSNPKAAAQGIEEAAPAMAAAGCSDDTASLQQPEQVAQPDTVMSEVLPSTAAAVFALVEDLPQPSPHAMLQRQAPVIVSFNLTATAAADPENLESTAAASHSEIQPELEMFQLDLQLPAADSRGADTAACEATSIGLEAPQQVSAAEEVASCVQQAQPDMSASLAGGDVEVPVPMLESPSAPDGPKQALWHDTTAAAVGTLQVPTNDREDTKAPPSEAQCNLAMSEITGQAPASESAGADVLSEPSPPADIVSTSPIQPSEPSLSTAPASVVATAHEPATGNVAGEAEGMEASTLDPLLKVKKLPLSCTSSDVQDHDNCTLSERNQVQCTSVPSLASASLEGEGAGTVVMLGGNSLLGLAGYDESDPDSGS